MLIDLSGQRFGMLLAVEVDRRDGKRPRWRCRCDCGGETFALPGNLRRGGATSCGCKRAASTRARCTKHQHGRRGQHSAEYRTWRSMLARCRDVNKPGYGADGIEVCARWANGEDCQHGFLCFLEDMGPRPSARHSIDRISSSGNYEPANCRWADKVQQARNRRSTKTVIIKGRAMAVAEAAEVYQVNYATLQYRLKHRGMSPEAAVGLGQA